MLVPTMTYGTYKDVNRRIQKAVTLIASNKSLEDALGLEGWIDSESVTGLCVLNGPSPILGAQAHHQLWLPWSRLEIAASSGRISTFQEEKIFEESLESCWSIIGLIAHANQIWLYPDSRREKFLMAAVRFWREIDNQGAWYTNGDNQGQNIWDTHNNIKYVLANFGATLETLSKPLPNEDLALFTKKYISD